MKLFKPCNFRFKLHKSQDIEILLDTTEYCLKKARERYRERCHNFKP